VDATKNTYIDLVLHLNPSHYYVATALLYIIYRNRGPGSARNAILGEAIEIKMGRKRRFFGQSEEQGPVGD